MAINISSTSASVDEYKNVLNKNISNSNLNKSCCLTIVLQQPITCARRVCGKDSRKVLFFSEMNSERADWMHVMLLSFVTWYGITAFECIYSGFFQVFKLTKPKFSNRGWVYSEYHGDWYHMLAIHWIVACKFIINKSAHFSLDSKNRSNSIPVNYTVFHHITILRPKHYI